VDEKDLSGKVKEIEKFNSDVIVASIHDFDGLEKLKKEFMERISVV
jgi:hypothetical protein